MSVLEFRGVNKWFGDFQVLKDINFSVDAGEVVVVIGPSGSGKSTLLRSINGLEKISSGQLLVDDEHLENPRTKLDALRAEIGFVFSSSTSTPI